VCVCSLSYPACALLAVAYFPTLSQNGTILEKKKFRTNCVIRFSLLFLFEIFLIIKIIQQGIIIKVYRSSWKYPLLLSHLNKLKLSLQVFNTYSNTKFHGNPSSGIQVIPWKRTDRYSAASSCLFQFCEHTETWSLIRYVLYITCKPQEPTSAFNRLISVRSLRVVFCF
jgi:hypothetical protein